MKLFKTVWGGLLAGGVASAFAISIAAAAPIEDRQAAMKEVGDSMKALAQILQGKQEFDVAVVKSNADNMAEQFEKARELFPEGSDTGEKETWAKPEIWQSNDEFVAVFDDAIDAAHAVAAVNSMDELKAGMGKLGGTCKSCHEKFRRPKD